MKLLEKLKWHRIGYVEGSIQFSESTLLTARSILYVRDPFLCFKTRKAVEIGDYKTIKNLQTNSQSHREYKLKVDNWLLGGKIDYVSENSTSEPAKIIRLVK
jgi:hypothetical protein